MSHQHQFDGLCTGCRKLRPLANDGAVTPHQTGDGPCDGATEPPVPGTERCRQCHARRIDIAVLGRTPNRPIQHKMDCSWRHLQPAGPS